MIFKCSPPSLKSVSWPFHGQKRSYCRLILILKGKRLVSAEQMLVLLKRDSCPIVVGGQCEPCVQLLPCARSTIFNKRSRS